MALREPNTGGNHEDADRPASAASRPRARATRDDAPRTRGGWTPAGTAAERRAVHNQRGTARGERTRRQIIDAARRVFERDGYFGIGVPDIAREAGIAYGSFYTYFTSKQEVFHIIGAEASELVDRAVGHRPAGERHLDPVDALCQANLRYIETYRQNARIYALIEQLGRTDAELHQRWARRRRQQTGRIGAVIRRWQAQGLADPSVAAGPTAVALISMIASLCYCMFVGYDEEQDFDVEQAGDAVNQVWIRAIDLRRSPNPRWLNALDIHIEPC
jgi:AcrR family transcriptional regulator